MRNDVLNARRVLSGATVGAAVLTLVAAVAVIAGLWPKMKETMRFVGAAMSSSHSNLYRNASDTNNARPRSANTDRAASGSACGTVAIMNSSDHAR